ncbi:MAG TPA: TetR/AcrR family transcriptional regulator [Puia sp.]|jgi:AcrR family transcriptional regulator|nr:TetR/AcrR family transcriptional regulator [Puia sp.]
MKPSLSIKQTQLLDSAELLFSQKGFDGTSVRDIAEAAGINTAMISYYFGSKEKLMEEIFERKSLNLLENVEKLLKDDSLDPFQKMYGLVDIYIDNFLKRKAFHRILLCEQIINQNPSIIQMVEKMKTRNSENINELIRLGQKKGLFKKNIDIPMLTNTLVGTVSYMLINLEFYKKYHHMETLKDEDFERIIKKKLSVHLRTIYKAILTHES